MCLLCGRNAATCGCSERRQRDDGSADERNPQWIDAGLRRVSVHRGGRTMVLFRKIFEALGLEVVWDPVAQKVTGKRGGLTLELFIGKTTAYKNGQPVGTRRAGKDRKRPDAGAPAVRERAVRGAGQVGRGQPHGLHRVRPLRPPGGQDRVPGRLLQLRGRRRAVRPAVAFF